MTYEEAIKLLKCEATNLVGWGASEQDEKKARLIFDKVDAIDVAIESLEKQIPQKPNVKKWVALDDAVYTYHCPHCDVDYNKYYIGSHHCKFCGQAIDWSDE